MSRDPDTTTTDIDRSDGVEFNKNVLDDAQFDLAVHLIPDMAIIAVDSVTRGIVEMLDDASTHGYELEPVTKNLLRLMHNIEVEFVDPNVSYTDATTGYRYSLSELRDMFEGPSSDPNHK